MGHDADVHRKLPKNYRKLGNNYGIGLGLVFRFSVTQWHYGAVMLLLLRYVPFTD